MNFGKPEEPVAPVVVKKEDKSKNLMIDNKGRKLAGAGAQLVTLNTEASPSKAGPKTFSTFEQCYTERVQGGAAPISHDT
jgi:hypothetical protein